MSFRMVPPPVPRGLCTSVYSHKYTCTKLHSLMCTCAQLYSLIYRHGYHYTVLCVHMDTVQTLTHTYAQSHTYSHIYRYIHNAYTQLHMHNFTVTPLCAYTKHKSHTYACTQADTSLINLYPPVCGCLHSYVCGVHYTTESTHTCTYACACSFFEAKVSIPVLESPKRSHPIQTIPQDRETQWPSLSVPCAQALSSHCCV